MIVNPKFICYTLLENNGGTNDTGFIYLRRDA